MKPISHPQSINPKLKKTDLKKIYQKLKSTSTPFNFLHNLLTYLSMANLLFNQQLSSGQSKDVWFSMACTKNTNKPRKICSFDKGDILFFLQDMETGNISPFTNYIGQHLIECTNCREHLEGYRIIMMKEKLTSVEAIKIYLKEQEMLSRMAILTRLNTLNPEEPLTYDMDLFSDIFD